MHNSFSCSFIICNKRATLFYYYYYFCLFFSLDDPPFFFFFLSFLSFSLFSTVFYKLSFI
ncbi:hypothetical protein BD560DRAFT_388986 [Blakeslea trispora]|nr:hypothetical protein BD560DRAFT_388986 [Blakeslea trispora]